MNDKKILGLIKVIIYALLMNLLPVQDTEQATETLGKIFLEEIRDEKLLFEYRIAVFDSKELINRKIVTEAERSIFRRVRKNFTTSSKRENWRYDY